MYHPNNTAKPRWPPIYARIFFLFPIWAEKPVLMGATERREPHELQVTNDRRFSPLLNSVSGDLHVLHDTYSMMYLRRTVSSCFGWKRPLMTSRRLPSVEPLVPNSANRNAVTCSSDRFMRLQISARLAKMVFLLPSRTHWGGGIL